MRPREFARRVAARHRRRECAPSRVATTLLRRWAHPVPRPARAPDTHVHHWRLVLHARVAAGGMPAASCGRARDVAAGVLGTGPERGQMRALHAAHRPPGALRGSRPPAIPAPAVAAQVRRAIGPVAAASVAANAPAINAAEIAPVPSVLRRAPAAPAPEAPPASAATVGLARPEAPAPGSRVDPGPAPFVPAAEVERITDQVVASIDRRIHARRERLGRV